MHSTLTRSGSMLLRLLAVTTLIAEARFRQQFVGKTARDELRVGSDITIDPDASGAARALAAGVRRALILIEELALKQDAAGEKAPPPTPE